MKGVFRSTLNTAATSNHWQKNTFGYFLFIYILHWFFKVFKLKTIFLAAMLRNVTKMEKQKSYLFLYSFHETLLVEFEKYINWKRKKFVTILTTVYKLQKNVLVVRICFSYSLWVLQVLYQMDQNNAIETKTLSIRSSS